MLLLNSIEIYLIFLFGVLCWSICGVETRAALERNATNNITDNNYKQNKRENTEACQQQCLQNCVPTCKFECCKPEAFHDDHGKSELLGVVPQGSTVFHSKPTVTESFQRSVGIKNNNNTLDSSHSNIDYNELNLLTQTLSEFEKGLNNGNQDAKSSIVGKKSIKNEKDKGATQRYSPSKPKHETGRKKSKSDDLLDTIEYLQEEIADNADDEVTTDRNEDDTGEMLIEPNEEEEQDELDEEKYKIDKHEQEKTNSESVESTDENESTEEETTIQDQDDQEAKAEDFEENENATTDQDNEDSSAKSNDENNKNPDASTENDVPQTITNDEVSVDSSDAKEGTFGYSNSKKPNNERSRHSKSYAKSYDKGNHLKKDPTSKFTEKYTSATNQSNLPAASKNSTYEKISTVSGKQSKTNGESVEKLAVSNDSKSSSQTEDDPQQNSFPNFPSTQQQQEEEEMQQEQQQQPTTTPQSPTITAPTTTPPPTPARKQSKGNSKHKTLHHKINKEKQLDLEKQADAMLGGDELDEIPKDIKDSEKVYRKKGKQRKLKNKASTFKPVDNHKVPTKNSHSKYKLKTVQSTVAHNHHHYNQKQHRLHRKKIGGGAKSAFNHIYGHDGEKCHESCKKRCTPSCKFSCCKSSLDNVHHNTRDTVKKNDTLEATQQSLYLQDHNIPPSGSESNNNKNPEKLNPEWKNLYLPEQPGIKPANNVVSTNTMASLQTPAIPAAVSNNKQRVATGLDHKSLKEAKQKLEHLIHMLESSAKVISMKGTTSARKLSTKASCHPQCKKDCIPACRFECCKQHKKKRSFIQRYSRY